ncbi:hypothetical protein [Anaerotignum sp.]|uniref:hypothetical protein n=1 Tax=Anaerotignum sp. TaxID=2039241 RepID=UPI0028AEB49C|nr:hypothetical protein [Anaerotignum sp.]
MVTFGLANASTKLEGCKTALEGMTDNTKRTTTSNSIRGTFLSGATEQIFGKTGEGYCSTNSLIRIPVANLKPENIKSGVNVGGVVGNVIPKPTEISGFYISTIYPSSVAEVSDIYSNLYAKDKQNIALTSDPVMIIIAIIGEYNYISGTRGVKIYKVQGGVVSVQSSQCDSDNKRSFMHNCEYNPTSKVLTTCYAAVQYDGRYSYPLNTRIIIV